MNVRRISSRGFFVIETERERGSLYRLKIQSLQLCTFVYVTNVEKWVSDTKLAFLVSSPWFLKWCSIFSLLGTPTLIGEAKIHFRFEITSVVVLLFLLVIIYSLLWWERGMLSFLQSDSSVINFESRIQKHTESTREWKRKLPIFELWEEGFTDSWRQERWIVSQLLSDWW